jgi:hypothetical protein
MEIKPGVILAAARRDSAKAFKRGMWLLALCVAVFGYNWKYIYNNGAAGPFPLLIQPTTPSRWAWNMVVLLAIAAFPLTLVFVGYTAWGRSKAERHRAIAALKRHGDPLKTVEAVEEELLRASDRDHSGPIWITPSWIVALHPTLHVYAFEDLVAVAADSTPRKPNDRSCARYSLRIWLRGRAASVAIPATCHEVDDAVMLVRARVPWALVRDVADFEQKWNREREACEQHGEAHRNAAAA